MVRIWPGKMITALSLQQKLLYTLVGLVILVVLFISNSKKATGQNQVIVTSSRLYLDETTQSWIDHYKQKHHAQGGILRVEEPSEPHKAILAEKEVVVFRPVNHGLSAPVTVRLLREDKPRLLYMHKVIREEEAAAVVKAATSLLERSRVSGSDQGTVSAIRTSQGCFFPSNFPPLAGARKVLSKMTGLPTVNFEDTQVLRYEEGQQYRPHPDALSQTKDLERGGQRVASALMWLNQVPKGGGTEFPRVEVRLKPVKGDGIIWFNVNQKTGQIDHDAMHAGLPAEGNHTKWVAVVWMRERPFK